MNRLTKKVNLYVRMGGRTDTYYNVNNVNVVWVSSTWTKQSTCQLKAPHTCGTVHYRQPTLWLHDLCLEILTVHGNDLRLSGAKELPLLYFLISCAEPGSKVPLLTSLV